MPDGPLLGICAFVSFLAARAIKDLGFFTVQEIVAFANVRPIARSAEHGVCTDSD